MGTGVGLWLSLTAEPGVTIYTGAGVLWLGALVIWRRGPENLRPMGAALFCIILGFLAIGVRAHWVSAPVLDFRYYGPIEGRIAVIDRSQSDVMRLTLDRVVLENTPPARTPHRVRVSLHGDSGSFVPEPGQRVMLTGHLSAPDGPVEPGGFDFQRMAWFRSLGAVGYTRTPVLVSAPPVPGEQWVNRLRMTISRNVQSTMPGEAGGFAAAVLTGDRSGVGQVTTQALRDSNLAHLLAISGLHMGLLTGFVFVALRMGLALMPWVALRLDTKKLAAVLALGAAAFYLMLSGGNVATQRAFVMVAVMLGAVLADRRALSIRSVAMAAMILLAIYPEAVAEPGFQMSFAATTVLIAGFAALRQLAVTTRLPRWLRPLAMLVISSSLAGLATAPVAAAHFGRIAEYGLLANILAVPMMGTVIIPAAVVAAALAPLSAAGPALWAMEMGTSWILLVAHRVAELEGAVRPVAAPAGWVLPVMALGALWVLLWPFRARWAGVLPMAVAFWGWQMADRPPVLIAADAGLVGVMGPEGRILSAPRGNGFTARIWLENDGDEFDQLAAAGRAGFVGEKGNLRTQIGGVTLVHISGKGAEALVPAACVKGALVVVAAEVQTKPKDCTVIDQAVLSQTGPVALRPDGQGGYRVVPTHSAQRMWSQNRNAP